MTAITKKRCAIYTRKSVDDGLQEQEFNSLDAQREAGEAYIVSQKGNGWVCLPEHYDDGGFSGGNTERPALKKLLADADAGLVDIIVVYKIDRLSRSICDFAELTKKFDAWGVSFVAVTQEINTATSAGRMMLNILITFAQYEREQIAERVRDKMSASRKKGKWVGGSVAYGYKVIDKKLVENPDESELVRRIFQRFIDTQSPKLISAELKRDGHRTRQGKEWDTSHIYRMLNNHTYIGEVKYKEHLCTGEHIAIIEQSAWDRTREILRANNPLANTDRKSITIAPLKGILRCGHCNSAMSPTFTRKDGKKYHYYICIKDSKRAESTCPVKQIAAGEIENMVKKQMLPIICSPAFIAKVSGLTGDAPEELNAIFQKELWNEITPGEYHRLLQLLLESAIVRDDSMELIVKTNGVKSIMEEVRNADNGNTGER